MPTWQLARDFVWVIVSIFAVSAAVCKQLSAVFAHHLLIQCCCAVLCCAVPCCAVLCCAVLCCAVLCCAALRSH